MNYFPDDIRIGLIEVPGEISLILPLSGCGHNCVGCHSPEYQNPSSGNPFTVSILEHLLEDYKEKCSCLCIFGGEHGVSTISLACDVAKSMGYKTALYSGYEKMWDIAFPIIKKLDYLKLGGYDESLGGLESKTTNQKMYKMNNCSYENITEIFWRNRI